MDRSFLSRPEVIAASRRFVCIRLATYENEREGELLKSIFLGRSGELENTTFTVLSPDGERTLVRPGRSPRMMFRDADEMATSLHQIADRHDAADGPVAADVLPQLSNVRLALNVAACEGRPLAVVYAGDEQERAALEAQVARLTWQEELQGRCVFAVSRDADELQAIGVEVEGNTPRVLMITPQPFGLEGTLHSEWRAGDDLEALLSRDLPVVETAVGSTRDHVRQGQSDGIHWDTVMPVTDPGRRGRRGEGPPGRRPPPPR